MRRDVQFALTVGAVLAVTIIVYVIVLSNGSGSGTSAPDPSVAGNPPADSSANVPPPPSPSGVADAPAQTPADGTPSEFPSGGAHPPRVMDSPASRPSELAQVPATRPDTSASGFDWDYSLTHGSAPSVSPMSQPPTIEPSRTQTPPLDRVVAADVTPVRTVQPDVMPPMIDGPSTRPDAMIALAAPASPMPAVMAHPAGPATPRTHVVAAGESLWTIAAAVYGNGAYYTHIAQANPTIDPRHLKVGTTLAIPELSVADTATARPSPAPAPTAGASAGPGGSYTVVARDTLAAISEKIYGTAAMTELIYQANQKLIGPDRNVLKIGWVLKLPSAPAASASSATPASATATADIR